VTTVGTWFEQRSFHHDRYSDIAALARAKQQQGRTVTLVFPTKNVAETIGPILDKITESDRQHRLVDEILVVDADSPDGTADIARQHGATVYSENDLMPAFGRNSGKGDAMWRSLSVAKGDIVMFADSDTREFPPHFVNGTLGPMLTEPDVGFVKAGYRRPFVQGDKSTPDGGGRVTELMAKPLLNLLYPQLAGFVQPLAGEFAASKELFASIPFFTGYGVEAGIMIDALDELGLDRLAQVDLGERINRHQELVNLGQMSHSILRAVLQRANARVAGPHPAESVFAGTMLRYYHAVSSPHGFQLEEYAEELFERPPMNVALATLSLRR
jgi:glucosyl-3-phosphoglycerate synthase